MKGMNARAGPLANDQIDAKIFHGGIENFFHGGLQAVNFIEKENFAGFQRSKDGGEIALALEQRPGAARSMAGPEVTRRLVPSSVAITPAMVVLPSPGGPYSRT